MDTTKPTLTSKTVVTSLMGEAWAGGDAKRRHRRADAKQSTVTSVGNEAGTHHIAMCSDAVSEYRGEGQNPSSARLDTGANM